MNDGPALRSLGDKKGMFHRHHGIMFCSNPSRPETFDDFILIGTYTGGYSSQTIDCVGE